MSCPCGSGKKFKWCCQPIHAEIDRAFQQQEDGQHEAALRTIEDVVKSHADNAEAWGRKAQLLHMNGKIQDAEQALEHAFKINPNYAYGHLLQGLFRQAEGELIGAGILFRKASELYAPDANEQLGFLFQQLADIELKRNHPVAARYALSRVMALDPQNAELKDAVGSIFGPESRVADVARREYLLQGREPNRPEAWKQAVFSAQAGRLGEAQKAFEALSQGPKVDPLAWYNIGLLSAWMGENKPALEALDHYVERERDEAKAVEAAALSEVLRLGEDVMDDTDYVVHRQLIEFKDGNAVVGLLQDWENNGRLIGVRSSEQEGILTALILEQTTTLIGAAAASYAALAGYLLVAGGVMSVWHTNPQAVTKLAGEVKEKLGPALGQAQELTTPAQFGDVVLEAMLFPTFGRSAPDMNEKIRERATHYFEEVWAHRPLKSLAGNTPIDAAGSPVLRRKLLGAIKFLEQCLEGSAPRRGSEVIHPYDFDRLRHKLGVDTPAPPPPGPVIDFSSLSAANLAGLDTDELTNEQLERAYRAALGLDAGELATKFVKALVARPADPARPDLYPFYKYLIDQAQTRGDWAAAIAHTEAAEKADVERNEGRRRNDYELRRGQLLAKRGDATGAEAVFSQLTERAPQELKYRGSAAEAMLSLRQGTKAAKFAQAGLDEALKQQNRDMEAYFRELVAAAKKQGG
jgi:tetratricopeptide (TPR) repeat protein